MALLAAPSSSAAASHPRAIALALNDLLERSEQDPRHRQSGKYAQQSTSRAEPSERLRQAVEPLLIHDMTSGPERARVE